MQRVFILIWGLQIVAFCYLVAVFERYTEGEPLTRMRILLAVIALMVQFCGIFFMWVQNARVSDLEYRQETFSETMQAALKKEVK